MALKIVPSVTGLKIFGSLKYSLGAWRRAPVSCPVRFAVVELNDTTMLRIARTPACVCARFGKCACQWTKQARRRRHQTIAKTPLPPRPKNSLRRPPNPPLSKTFCRALEQSAAENSLPVEFFARVIWQESRFDAQLSARREPQVSPNLCRRPPVGTALADPFDPMELLSRDRWDKIDTPRAILASLPPTTVRWRTRARHDLLNRRLSFRCLQ